MSTSGTRRWMSLVTAAGLLLVAACGSDDDGGADTTAASPAETAATTTETTAAADESTTSAPEASAEPLKIGHIFTANPAVGAIGQYYDGFRTYFDELNANGGIDGQMVEIEAIDSQLTAEGTQAAFETLANDDDVLAITGLDISANAALGVQRAEQDEITVALGGATFSESILPLKPWVFEFSEIFRDSLATMADYAKNQGHTKVGLLFIDSAEAHVADPFAQQFIVDQGLEVVTTQYLPVRGSTDFSPQVNAAKEAGADILFVLQGPSGYINVANAMVAADYNVPVLGGSAGLDPAVFEAFGDIEFLTESPYSPVDDSPAWGEMAAAALEHRSVNRPTASFVGGWVGGQIITEALRGCAPDCDRASFRDALEAVQNLDTGGLSAPISFGPDDHYAPSADRFYDVDETGAFVAVSDWIDYPEE